MKYTASLLFLYTVLVSACLSFNQVSAQENRGGDRREPPTTNKPKTSEYTPPNRGIPDTDKGTGTRWY